MKGKTNANEETPLGKILKTEDQSEQVKRIEELISAAGAPLFLMTIIYDPRVGNIFAQGMQANGGPMDFSMAHRMLDMARAELVKTETAQKAKQAVQEPTA